MDDKIKEISDIKLVDTGLYGKWCGFYNQFNKNNIDTIGQLFDMDLMTRLKLKMKRPSPQQLDAFISLIKYKYLGVIMPNIIYMDRPAFTKSNDKKVRLNFNAEDFGFNQYLIVKAIQMVNTRELSSDAKIIDVIKLGGEEFDERVKLYVDAYNKDKSFDDYNDIDDVASIIKKLKQQLEDAIKTRDLINSQIDNLQTQISEYESRKKV